MTTINFTEFDAFQKGFIPEGSCMIWEVENEEIFDKLIGNTGDGTIEIAGLPSTLIYYMCLNGKIDDQELEKSIDTMLNRDNTWIAILYHILSFTNSIHDNFFLMKRLKNCLPIINKWFLYPPRYEALPWRITVRVNKTQSKTVNLNDYITAGVNDFNKKNPDIKFKSEFGVLPENYEAFAKDYAKVHWETFFSDGKIFSWESYWEDFKKKELKYYRYTVYLLLNGKLRELLSQEEPYSLENYFRETEFHHRYGKSQDAGRLIVRTFNILAHFHPESIDIEAINTYFWSHYEKMEKIDSYLDYLFYIQEYKRFFESSIPSQFLNMDRMLDYVENMILNNGENLTENTRMRIIASLRKANRV